MTRMQRVATRLGVVLVVTAVGLPAIAAEDGQALYEKKCKACHSIKGEGGKMKDKGGALDGIGGKQDAAWLKAYLADPKSKVPDAKMPKLKLEPAEIDALVGFLGTLK